jgi:hypothetical protein
MNACIRRICISPATVVLALALSMPALAQPADVGRFDLSPIAGAVGQTPKVNINFGPAMMAGFAETLAPNSPELGDVIRSISGLRLMVFEDVEGVDFSGRIAQTASELRQAGWTAAIEVREDDANVDLYLNESQQFVEGLVLMVTEEGGAAVFANIFGELDPVMIGRMIGSGEALRNLDLGAISEQFESLSGDES